MGDLGEFWSDVDSAGQARRARNLVSSIDVLKQHRIDFKQLSPTHYRVGVFDFWPSPGLYIHTVSKKRGRGVFNLMKQIRKEQTNG